LASDWISASICMLNKQVKEIGKYNTRQGEAG
jgi:hypothetical protein